MQIFEKCDEYSMWLVVSRQAGRKGGKEGGGEEGKAVEKPFSTPNLQRRTPNEAIILQIVV